MNILALQNNIKTYIQTNFPDKIADTELSAFDAFIDDFVDLDKYKQNVLMFYDFTDYHFEPLSLNHRDMTATMHCILVLRGNDSGTLKENLIKYTDCFYDWFYDDECDSTFNGLVDLGRITDTDFYNAALGNINIKVADITISLKLEDI